MEYLVEFEVHIPEGTRGSVVSSRQAAEAAAAANLVDQGHLIRLWRTPAAPGESRALGLYRADDRAQLDALLVDLPLYDWMLVTVTALGSHPNDPEAAPKISGSATMGPTHSSRGSAADTTRP
jgi:muconolactone delta-isomerase